MSSSKVVGCLLLCIMLLVACGSEEPVAQQLDEAAATATVAPAAPDVTATPAPLLESTEDPVSVPAALEATPTAVFPEEDVVEAPAESSIQKNVVAPAALVANPGMACFGSGGQGLSCLTAAGEWQSYTTDNSPLGGDYIEALTVCGAEILIVHTSGISAFDGSQWREYESGWGFGSPTDVACDEQGNLWVTHFEGVSFFDGDSWTTYESEQLATGEQATDLVEAVAIDPAGAVWVATANSLARFRNDEWTIYQVGQGFDDQYFLNDIAIDERGRPWASHSSGLLEYSDGQWIAHQSSDFFSLESMAVDGANQVWVGTFSDGLYTFDGSTWRNVAPAGGNLSSAYVRAITVDGRGRLWLGTDWGLNVFDGSQWTVYRMDNADIVDNNINTLALLGGGPALPAVMEKAPGSLHGSVTIDGEPLAEAPVEICVQQLGFSYYGDTPCADQPLFFATTTDASGSFSFEQVPAGLYVITVNTGNGWAQLTTEYGFGSERVLVEAGQDTDVGQLTISGEE